MLGQIFINASHLNKFSPQNIKMHVYEHRQAADRRDHYLEFEGGLLEDLPEEVEAELLAVEHVQALVTLDVIQTKLKLGLDLTYQSPNMIYNSIGFWQH